MMQRLYKKRSNTAKRRGPAIPVLCAAVLIAVLMGLSMGQMVVKAYLSQDGYAVPADTLLRLLRAGDAGGTVPLVGVDMGEAVYTHAVGGGNYYVGEDKTAISAGYPLYTQSGRVLAFLDGGSRMVTADWETLGSYEGLYLSEGVTFNADRSQADIAEVLLVRVDGGYLLAQNASVSSGGRVSALPMNSVCGFGEDEILFYAYDKGLLAGNEISVVPAAVITIGGHTYGYLDFLERLGLWEEENPAPTPAPTPTPSETPAPAPTEQPGVEPNTGSAAGNTAVQTPTGGSGEAGPVSPAEPSKKPQISREPSKPAGEAQDIPKPPTEVVEKPGEAVENPNSKPAPPAPPVRPTDPNPGYREPTVTFSGPLDPWVYTLTTRATVYDPSGALEGGVQVYVYEVAADGKEKQVMRRTVSAAESAQTVVLGQIKPDMRYHVTAKYTYRDKLNYPQTKELDLGSAATLPFDRVGTIRVKFYDEYANPAESVTAVKIYSDRLQLRHLTLLNVSTGKVTEADGVTVHPATDPGKAETYINSFALNAAVNGGGGRTELKMTAAVLRLLREGFVLDQWETPNSLRSSTEYQYTLHLTDRYGNEFTVEETTQGGGHTCMETPTVSILVPDKTNLAGSTQIQVTWKNPDNVPTGPNDRPGAAMGDSLKAGLYLVEKGQEVTPENAVELTAYPEQGGAAQTVTAKFLPVTVNTDGQVTTVTTTWVVTNLQVMKNYTAAVLCGTYDNRDGTDHRDETLEKSTDFLTASLSNLGTISYTAEVDALSAYTGRLKFRMNAADERLLPLLDQVAFAVEKKGAADTEQSFTLLRDDWKQVAVTPVQDPVTGRYTATVKVPVRLNGAEETREAELGLMAKALPVMEPGAGSAWDYLLASSATAVADEFWLTLTLGGDLSRAEGELPLTLMTLESKTSYVGRFSTTASQGGTRQDVTSGSSRTVNFTTLSEEAVVSFDNAFVSTDFIELYNVSILDADGCIRPDDADRGGGNVLVKVLNAGGTQVSSKYINSAETQASLRLSGLTKGQTYTLVFSAVKYADAGSGALELNRNLNYAEPQDPDRAWVYTFTTGESVVGDLSLTGVSQLYQDNDGRPTDSLGLLTADDFYYNVWQYGNRVYYYDGPDPTKPDETDKKKYLDQVEDDIERYPETKALAKAEGSSGMQILPLSAYTSNPDTQALLQDSWTSRFIKVEPGDQYTIYSPNYNGYAAITFYYQDAAGNLKYYGAWSNDYFMRGYVFTVPTTKLTGSNNADRICYMRLAAYNQNSSEGLVLEKYDDSRTQDSPDLADGVRIDTGVYLGTANGLTFDDTYAYTADYIPVTGGSFYEIKGRDPNQTAESVPIGTTGSASRVLFYNSDYVFLGSYEASNQTSVIRAPFGAAYMRANLLMKQVEGSSPAAGWPELSVKRYRNVLGDQYQATLRAEIADASDAQLLRDGTYTVALYTTAAAVSDSDNLSGADFVPLGEAQTFAVGPEDMKDGKLKINKTLQFDTLNPNRGFKAVLSISPAGWNGGSVVLDTVYFTTNRVVRTISTLADLKAIRNDPAGSYVVTEDISGVTGQILGSDRPFTGVIDFQGHTVTVDVFTSLFYRVSVKGVVKNLVLNYNAVSTTATTTPSGIGCVSHSNYGTIQNVIVRLNPDNQGVGADVIYFGGIARYNYGVIDGFVVEFQKDVRTLLYSGGICAENYGTVSNGYVSGVTLDDGNGAQHTAGMVYLYKDKNGQIVGSDTQRVALGVGHNSTRGTVSRVFAVGDLVVQSADASTDYSNADYQGDKTTNPDYYDKYETSVTGTHLAAILVGYNGGTVRDGYTYGDRRDYDAQRNVWSYMLARGPAVGYIEGRYTADNVTYFSNSKAAYSQNSSTVATVGTYNVRGELESLYDYQWQESVLGRDGGRFAIRSNVEAGYYPRLILPDCFPPDAQPMVPLPSLKQKKVEVRYNQVRVQGVSEALVSITMDFPFAPDAKVTGFEVKDRRNVAIHCEVLAQRPVSDGYRVDILLSLPADGSAVADSSYTITGVSWTGSSQDFTGADGARMVPASFWREISSVQDWKTYIAGATTPVYGNYLLAADLDFSASTSHTDWYCAQSFFGTLDGAVYSTKREPLMSDAGEVIKDAAGQPRTIEVWNEATGMRTISGVGNADQSGTWVQGRDETYRGGLFNTLRGTLRNVVFRNFKSVVNPAYANNPGARVNGVNGPYAGVVIRGDAGARMENCHVRDSVFYGTTHVGGLIGYGSGASLLGCSARFVEVNSFRRYPTDTATVTIGGLAGTLSGGLAEGCFAADVTVTAGDVYASDGAGGLVGYAASTTVQNCYSTGTVTAGASRVGGVAGYVAGEGTLTGCWSTATVSTVSDFAGGVVGFHGAGVLTNNFTSSTVITRSLTAGSVHRICSNNAYNEATRHDNYAFEGQYLTYFDPQPTGGDSHYQFGVWSEEDGATALLSREELKDPIVWKGRVGIADGYDLEGTAVSGHLSGGSRACGVKAGYMPKLTASSTGQLLYDQPDVEIGYVSSSVLSKVKIELDPNQAEEITVTVGVFSSRSDLLTAGLDDIADWDSLALVGASVVRNEQGKPIILDRGSVPSWGSENRPGRLFQFNIRYGDAAVKDGVEGHYLDSYMLTLRVYTGNVGSSGVRESELLQTRLSLSQPVYRIILDIDDWDKFFSDSRYANAYENVQIGWSGSGVGAGEIDFSETPKYGNSHQYNVKVNRLTGAVKPGTESDPVYPTLKNLDVTFQTPGQSLVNQAVTELSNLNFEQMKLSSTWTNDKGVVTMTGGNFKGVVGQMLGDMRNVTFRDITVDGGSGAYAGCTGIVHGTVDKVKLEHISVKTTSSYVGALTGYAQGTATISNVSLTAPAGKRNTVTSVGNGEVGGLIGRLYGVASGLSVKDTDVIGRASVGGAVGIMYSDGTRQDEIHLSDVTVGDASKANPVPGATSGPGVTVTLNEGGPTTGDMRNAGGVVGYISAQQVRSLNAFDVRVGVYTRATKDAANDGTYGYYVGGVVGNTGSGIQDSLAENCTVITYDSRAGGLNGGNGGGRYNTVRRCAVYGLSDKTRNVGGLAAVGGMDRGLVEQCVVAGDTNVGGIVGQQSVHIRESGVVDSVVLGRESVGGITGNDTYYHFYSNHVSATQNEDGTPAVTTRVSAAMLADYDPDGTPKTTAPGYLQSATNREYPGSTVLGETNVGGLVGQFGGVELHNSWVGSGVAVEGKTNVGGLAGQFYGWYAGRWDTTNRGIWACAMGATVTGESNVGGVAGEYTRTAGSTNLATADAPTADRFYSVLITGSVKGDANTAILIPGVPTDGTKMKNCRVWEGVKLNDAAPAGLAKWSTVYGVTGANSKPLMTATAEEIGDSNFYFLPVTAPYGAMGWSRSYWGDESMQHLYTQVSDPADFESYESGIAKPNDLVLWLDARSNTGKGYTDPSATTWTDLSGEKNNATLYWNNKAAGSSFTIGERTSFMRWNEGALEFPGTGNAAAYYAQLEKSLSPYLQTGYTVELVYSYAIPTYTQTDNFWNHVLGWRDGGYSGGFRVRYQVSSSLKGNIYLQTDYNAAGSAVGTTVDGKAGQDSFLRRTTTVTEAQATDGKNKLTTYVDGNLGGTGNSPGMPFRNTEDTVWRVGYGPNGNAALRISGIRVYKSALTADEVKQNAEYDQWYYFGGAKPANAVSKTADLTLNEDGSIPSGGTYALLRSEDGSYNGTLVTDTYTGGGLGSRGYYYLLNTATGDVSNVVQKKAPGYGPVLRSRDMGNEYYGTPRTYFVRGQEGADRNVDDRLYQGGYRLPDADTVTRVKTWTAIKAILAKLGPSAIPNLTAYASGADTVNLELAKDAPEGLVYTLRDGDGNTLLEGPWPQESRTLTMSWDFLTPFTVQLGLGEETGEESQWTSGDLARTVMTHGVGWWYLYGSECYDSEQKSLDPSKGFVHMMDGLLLDDGGGLWNAEDLSAAGAVTAFQIRAAKPLWSGEVGGAAVESYGTYLRSDGGLKETQLVVKGNRAYAMPGSRVSVGSFVADAYGENVYTTVLGSDGTLCDMGHVLSYPEDLAVTGIRELSNTLGYSGHVVLVRYQSGKLAAFDYLTGETFPVLSREDESISLLDFILSGGGRLRKSSVLYGGAEQSLAAVEYQSEVEGDASLRTALANLKDNPENTADTDGEGSGVYAEGQPGGVDGPAGEGSDADNGLGDVYAPDQTVTPEGGDAAGEETGGTLEPGSAQVPGTAEADGTATAPGTALENGTAEEDGTTQAPGTAEAEGTAGTPRPERGDDKAAPDAEKPKEGGEPGTPAETEPTVQPATTPAPAQGGAGGTQSANLVTRYVTVYDPETETGAVYDLEELLTQPQEELVTQEERSEQLKKQGYTTSLLSQPAERPSASGLTLMLLVSVGVAGLLVCMVLLRKRRLDQEEP